VLVLLIEANEYKHSEYTFGHVVKVADIGRYENIEAIGDQFIGPKN